MEGGLDVDIELRRGDARELDWLPDESIRLIVTSPPYWTLKDDNDHPRQLGAVEGYDQFLDELDRAWTRMAVAEAAGHVLSAVRVGFSGDVSEDGRWLETDDFARAALVHAWRRRREGVQRNMDEPTVSASLLPDGEDTQPDPEGTRLAREIGRALRSTLDALNVHHAQLSQDAREDFVMGKVQAITATAHIPFESHPLR